MPISAATALGLTLLGVGTAVGVGVALQPKPKKKKKISKLPKAPKVSLEGVFQKGAMLGNTPFVVDDSQLPIHLTTLDEPSYTAKYGGGYQTFERVPLLSLEGNEVEQAILGTTTIVNGQETSIAGKDALKAIVTSLTTDATRKAYELALAYVSVLGPVDWTDPGQRDPTIRKILGQVAPGADWSRGLEPYQWGDDPSLVWAGVQLLGTVANQSYHNKVAMGGG